MVITNLPATISLFEDIPVGTFIFEVQAVYDFTWSTILEPDYVYSLLTETTNFEMDSNTGGLYISLHDFTFFALLQDR